MAHRAKKKSPMKPPPVSPTDPRVGKAGGIEYRKNVAAYPKAPYGRYEDGSARHKPRKKKK